MNSEEKGWISIPRSLKSSFLWKKKEAEKLRWWMEMMFMAEWNESEITIGKSNEMISRGDFLISRRKLAERMGCSEQTIRTFLNRLEKEGLISRRRPHQNISIIKMEKYDPCNGGKEAAEAEENIYIIPAVIQMNKSRSVTLKLIHTLNESPTFWGDMSKGLGRVPVESLRELAEMCYGELLAKEDFKNSLTELRAHVFNWIRNHLRIEKKRIISNKLNTTKNGKASADSRRGIDEEYPERKKYSKGRF